ncbi:hypothetical protein NL676_019919 [Syzygium grande]|nr:hypothetical protein NL676_019919 [Syzygium grande]
MLGTSVTWQVVCRYAPPRGYKLPCCMSLSSDQGMNISCATYARDCKPSDAELCARSSGKSERGKSPVQTHQPHVPHQRKLALAASISNLNRHANYTDWILMIQHPVAQKFASANTNFWSQPPELGTMEVVWGDQTLQSRASGAGEQSDMAGGVPLRSAARIQAAVLHVLVLRSRDEYLVRYIRARMQAPSDAELCARGSTAKLAISYKGSPGKWNFSSDVFFNDDQCANLPLP